MRLNLKFRQKFKFTATAFLMVFGANAQSNAQKSAHAVMDVSVKIVSAPIFADNIITDITYQLQQIDQDLNLGEYTINFPKGIGYAVSIDPIITMEGKTKSWNIDTSVKSHTDNQGKLTLKFRGKSDSSSTNLSESARGRLTTNINYL